MRITCYSLMKLPARPYDLRDFIRFPRNYGDVLKICETNSPLFPFLFSLAPITLYISLHFFFSSVFGSFPVACFAISNKTFPRIDWSFNIANRYWRTRSVGAISIRPIRTFHANAPQRVYAYVRDRTMFTKISAKISSPSAKTAIQLFVSCI